MENIENDAGKIKQIINGMLPACTTGRGDFEADATGRVVRILQDM